MVRDHNYGKIEYGFLNLYFHDSKAGTFQERKSYVKLNGPFETSRIELTPDLRLFSFSSDIS